MKKLTFALSVALAVTLGWTGATIPPVFAETVVPAEQVQTQSIEHMKTIRVNVNPITVTVWENWFNPANGLQRNDQYHYSVQANEKEKTELYTYESSLFERTIKKYQEESVWKSIGVSEINGKQVEMLKGNGNPKGNPVYHIAYIDQSTGLPIQVEDYNSNDEVMTVYLFIFDYVTEQQSETLKKDQ
ncbi:hypothetical protein EDM52_23915 [Brevibacillus invocatus]|uniref:Uncharacterized protein n=1 Tax=Brevibacillus invocatus TaxID=173959 RepID=A0A3M8BP03_9BACL|nr:hypothetical protein [Brevibacillus invocatus]RNB65044.1 hypothetical protein EDM52_23915 [Brevibacillus invocatus]